MQGRLMQDQASLFFKTFLIWTREINASDLLLLFQIGFLNNIAIPIFSVLADILPSTLPLLEGCK